MGPRTRTGAELLFEPGVGPLDDGADIEDIDVEIVNPWATVLASLPQGDVPGNLVDMIEPMKPGPYAA